MEIITEILSKIGFIGFLDIRYYIGILLILEYYLYLYLICILLVVLFNRKSIWKQ